MPEDRYVYKAQANADGQVKVFRAKLVKETEKLVIIEKSEYVTWVAFGYRVRIPKDEIQFSPLEAAQEAVKHLLVDEAHAQRQYQLVTRRRKSAEALVRQYTEVARVVEP